MDDAEQITSRRLSVYLMFQFWIFALAVPWLAPDHRQADHSTDDPPVLVVNHLYVVVEDFDLSLVRADPTMPAGLRSIQFDSNHRDQKPIRIQFLEHLTIQNEGTNQLWIDVWPTKWNAAASI